MDIFDLFAKITLDKSDYEKGLSDAEKTTQSFGDRLKGGLGTAAKIGAGAIAGVAAGATALTAAVIKGAGETSAYGDRIDKMSQKMGLSNQAFQEWDYVLGQSGASIDSMSGGIKTLTNLIDSASAGGAEAQEAFAKLGISMDDLATMSREDVFAATIKGFQGMEDNADRAALATKVLGRSGAELTPLFNTSAEATQELIDASHRLGFVMSDEQVKASAAYGDSLDNLTKTFGGLKNSLFSQFMPSLTTVMDGLTEIFGGDSEKGIGLISDGIDQLVTDISDKLPQFIDVGMEILMAIVDAIIDNLPKLLEASAEIIGKLVAGIIENIPELIKAIPQIIAAIVKGLANAWPELKKAGAELLMMLGEGILSVVSKAGDWGIEMIAKFSEGFSGAFDDLKRSVVEKFDSIREKIGDIFDNARETIKKAIDKIKGLFNFEWKLPKIKLPHFSWSWKDVGGILKLPSIRVEWYKKAYDNPYLFTQPTVFNGKGFGDGGGSGEIVYGRDQLMRDIAQASQGSITVNVYASDGMDIDKLTEQIEQRLTQWQKQRDRAYA